MKANANGGRCPKGILQSVDHVVPRTAGVARPWRRPIEGEMGLAFRRARFLISDEELGADVAVGSREGLLPEPVEELDAAERTAQANDRWQRGAERSRRSLGSLLAGQRLVAAARAAVARLTQRRSTAITPRAHNSVRSVPGRTGRSRAADGRCPVVIFDRPLLDGADYPAALLAVNLPLLAQSVDGGVRVVGRNVKQERDVGRRDLRIALKQCEDRLGPLSSPRPLSALAGFRA